MDLTTLLVLFAGGVVAGGVTAVAGGASFLTFPMLIAAGLPPLAANITNWIALTPGNFMALAAYRTELADMRKKVRPHLWVSFAGGAVGGLLLLWTGEARFEKAVPWLILTATVFFALGEWIKKRLNALRNPAHKPSHRWLLVFEFALPLFAGAMLGGYSTVRFVKRVPERAVRNAVLVWAITLTAYSFWKYGQCVSAGARSCSELLGLVRSSAFTRSPTA